MGIVGATVVATWAYALVGGTGRILLGMTPDAALATRIRKPAEADGDRVADLRLWRLGPRHFGAIVSIVTARSRDAGIGRSRLRSFSSLSHVTMEVASQPASQHPSGARAGPNSLNRAKT